MSGRLDQNNLKSCWPWVFLHVCSFTCGLSLQVRQGYRPLAMPKGKKPKVQGGIFIAKVQTSRTSHSKFEVRVVVLVKWSIRGRFISVSPSVVHLVALFLLPNPALPDQKGSLSARSKSLCDVSLVGDHTERESGANHNSPASLRKHESVTNIPTVSNTKRSRNPIKKFIKKAFAPKTEYPATVDQATLEQRISVSSFDSRSTNSSLVSNMGRTSFDGDTPNSDKGHREQKIAASPKQPSSYKFVPSPGRTGSRPYSIAGVPHSNSMFSIKNQTHARTTHNGSFVGDVQRPYSIATPYDNRVEHTSNHSPTLSRNFDSSISWREQIRSRKQRTSNASKFPASDEWEDSTSFVIMMNTGPVCPSDPEYRQTAQELMTVSPAVMRNKSFNTSDCSVDVRRISDATTDSGVCGSESRHLRSLPGTPGAHSLVSVRNNSGISSPELRPSVSSGKCERMCVQV